MHEERGKETVERIAQLYAGHDINHLRQIGTVRKWMMKGVEIAVNLHPDYEPIIGLEVHAQMLTASKAFCSCSTRFGEEPNSNVCPVCLGMPGSLPVLNINLVEFILRMGVATRCRIAPRAVFARKNYFYPDLPKGYQISNDCSEDCHDEKCQEDQVHACEKSLR